MNRFCKTWIIAINIMISVTNGARADHVEQEVQTQTNKRSDLFEKSIPDLADFNQKLQSGKQAGVDSLGSSKADTPQGLSFISKKSKAELQNETSRLQAIDAHQLNSRGRDEIVKNNSINELYTDYSKPLNKKYLEDAKNMAAGQNALADNLFAKLKEYVDVDCKTVKGDKKHEPEYYLKLKQTLVKDTIYNQTYCEQLSNQYNCTDNLQLNCLEQAMDWGPWEQKHTTIYGPEIFYGRGWLYSEKYCRRRFHYYMSRVSWVRHQVRQYIADRHGVSIEHIHEHVGIHRHGSGRWHRLEGKGYISDQYHFDYQIRDGNLICTNWQEQWNERCILR